MVDQGPTLEVTQCPSYAAGLGYLGVAAAVCLSNWGSAVRLIGVDDSFRVLSLTNETLETKVLTNILFSFADGNMEGWY